MKKIFKMMMAVVAGFAALTACTNEPEEGVTPTPENEYVIVKVGMSKATKGSLTDTEGIKWAVGDQIKYAGGVELTSEALTAEDIEDDGYTANFKFPAALNEVNRTGWFTTSTRNLAEFDFDLNKSDGNTYSQTEAGVMNSDYIFLHSGTSLINITKDEAPKVEMYVAGGIFRFMPYTETYNNEVVKSVELKSNNGKHLIGTVAYDRGGGTYRGANDINWLHPKPFVKVYLDEPFALTNANSRENSKGVYMAIARTTETHPIEGYTITVKTDKATYTFSSDDNLVVGDNELRNVYLKLENGVRVDDTVQKGILSWEETLPENVTLGASAVTDQNIGFIFVKTQDLGSNTWQKRDKNAANLDYYEGITFETSEDWLTVGYAENNDNILVDAEANPNAEKRTATLTVTFADANGYLVDDANNSFTVTFTQAAAGSAKEIKVNASYGLPRNFTLSHQSLQDVKVSEVVDENVSAAIGNCYLVFEVDGVKLEGDNFWGKEETNTVYKSVDFFCHQTLSAAAERADWISIQYPTDTNGNINDVWPRITVQANTTGVQRQSLVRVLLTVPEGYIFKGKEAGETELVYGQFEITQKAYSAEIVATLNDVYVGTVGYEGEEITVGNLAMTADGEAVADANEFCNVAINGGASVALAANGTITATIPANASNTAKEYTVTIKDKSGNKLVEDVVIAQAANPEGGEVVEPEHTFSYTIFNNAADGSKGTGFSGGAGSIGEWYRFENITIDGRKYMPGNEMDELANNTELVSALMAQCFSFGEITNDDVQIPGGDPLTTNPESFVTLEPWSNGGAAIYVRIILTANDSGARRTFKIITKDGEGNQVSSIVYFQNQ